MASTLPLCEPRVRHGNVRLGSARQHVHLGMPGSTWREVRARVLLRPFGGPARALPSGSLGTQAECFRNARAAWRRHCCRSTGQMSWSMGHGVVFHLVSIG